MKFAIGIWLALVACVQAAGLEFSEPVKEMDAPADAATVTAEFKFTNKTAKPVTIAKADPTCSCLKVEISGGKLSYAPGESGVVKTTFEMGNFSGTVDKMLAIYLDADPADKPSVQLTLRVKIPVLIGVEPKTVKWEIGGEQKPEIIHIHMAEGQSILPRRPSKRRSGLLRPVGTTTLSSRLWMSPCRHSRSCASRPTAWLRSTRSSRRSP
jgi:hypothetical protein